MISAGVDLDTNKVDVVVVSNGQVEHQRVEFEGDTSFERAWDACGKADDLYFELNPDAGWSVPDVIGIERPMGPNTRGIADMMRIQGVVLANLPDTVIFELKPSEWRQEVGLKGNVSKGEVEQWVAERVSITERLGWQQDAYDAYCLAVAARNIYERGKK